MKRLPAVVELESIAATARALATELHTSDAVRCAADHNSCLEMEACRDLTLKEKALGWTMRPHWAYCPINLCAACAILWHADRAGQMLHEMLARATKTAALQAARAALQEAQAADAEASRGGGTP